MECKIYPADDGYINQQSSAIYSSGFNLTRIQIHSQNQVKRYAIRSIR